MSELIRKITGIGGPDEVNYIPVVYYCICNDPANTLEKNILWIGNSSISSSPVDTFKIILYKGLTLAVLFVNGIEKITEGEAASSGYTLKVGDNSYSMMLDDQKRVRGAEPNTVMLFEFTGDDFRLVNGFLPYVFDEFEEKVQEQLSNINRNKVNLQSDETGPISNTGSYNQPVYVLDEAVAPIVTTFGSPTKPVWFSDGHITESDVTVGSSTIPIYMNGGTLTRSSASVGDIDTPVYLYDGVITKLSVTAGGELADSTMQPAYIENGQIKGASVTIGNDTKPLKMENGELKAVEDDLALSTESINEIAFDSNTYVLSALNKSGETLSSVTLPLESMVIGATYTDGDVILTLKNGSTTSFPVVDIVDGLVKDSGNNGEGDNDHPVYVDSTGTVQQTTYDLSSFVTSAGEKYHIGGTYTLTAAASTTGLATTIPGQNSLGAITLNVPVYWGTNEPSGSAALGALYIQLENN